MTPKCSQNDPKRVSRASSWSHFGTSWLHVSSILATFSSKMPHLVQLGSMLPHLGHIFSILVTLCPPDAFQIHHRCSYTCTAAPIETRFPFHLSQVYVEALLGSCWLMLAPCWLMLAPSCPILPSSCPSCHHIAFKMPPRCHKMAQLSQK